MHEVSKAPFFLRGTCSPEEESSSFRDAVNVYSVTSEMNMSCRTKQAMYV